jgi:hypothetical protein
MQKFSTPLAKGHGIIQTARATSAAGSAFGSRLSIRIDLALWLSKSKSSYPFEVTLFYRSIINL